MKFVNSLCKLCKEKIKSNATDSDNEKMFKAMILKSKAVMSLTRDESTCVRYLMKAYRFRMSSIKDEVLGAKLMTLWYDGMIDICIYNRNLI